jgi:asparagine synthase (glutamine-hydrolysing)
MPPPPKVIGANYSLARASFPEIEKEFINSFLINSFQDGACQDSPKLERTFGAWGVEYRSPFLDLNFVKTAFSVTDKLKIRNGTQKYILRKALKNIVPDEFLFLPKRPQRMRYDLRFSIQLDGVVEKYLSREKVESRGFFKFSNIQNLRKRKKNKPYSPEGAMRLWTALLTEIWAIEFLDKQGSQNSEI